VFFISSSCFSLAVPFITWQEWSLATGLSYLKTPLGSYCSWCALIFKYTVIKLFTHRTANYRLYYIYMSYTSSNNNLTKFILLTVIKDKSVDKKQYNCTGSLPHFHQTSVVLAVAWGHSSYSCILKIGADGLLSTLNELHIINLKVHNRMSHSVHYRMILWYSSRCSTLKTKQL